MKQINKNVNEERLKEVIYCFLFLAFLFFLFLGDTIALHFLEKEPNPNNTVFKGGEKNDDLKVDFLTKTTFSEVIKKMRTHDDFILFSTRDTCETCKELLPLLKKAYEEDLVGIYYINREYVNEESNDYHYFLEKNPSILESFSYTPGLLFFKGGELQNSLFGEINQEKFDDFMIEYKKKERGD